jgi:hypothetical protein
MISEQTSPGVWRLSFSEPEAEFLVNVLARLGKHYQEDISRLPPALRAYWTGPISREKTAHAEELKESQEVLSEARTELREDRLSLAENWLRDYELAESRDPWQVEITGEERDEFISMLNDRRMLLAAEAGITQSDMETDPGQIANEARRIIVWEIDMLGAFILVMLGPQIYRP